MAKRNQLKLMDAAPNRREWARAEVPTNVTVIDTEGKSVDAIVAEMMAVPLDRSMLLDFLVGRERGDALSEDQANLYRLQMLLNSRYHNERFDFLGDSPISQMVRNSIANELWNPHKEPRGESK